MEPVRLSLADAATQLGLAPNSVRSRYKAGKLRGERDNAGRIWVWLEATTPSNQRASNSSNEPIERVSNLSLERFESPELTALRDHVQTLRLQLSATAEQRDAWQRQAETLLQQQTAHASRRGLFAFFQRYRAA